MKKLIIAAILVIVLVLIGFAVIRLTSQGVTQSIPSGSDVKMKATTGQIMLMIYQRGYGIKGVTAFEDNPSYMALVNTLLAKLRTDSGIDATSSIKSSDHSFVVKLMVNGAKEFYCGDTVHQQSGIVVVPINGDNFISSTDCTGEPLK
jgi:hypothetical protein